jgi:hypothetical protein
VGSHDNIVYMKEFVENKEKYYIVKCLTSKRSF